MLHFRPFEFTDSDYQTIFDIHMAVWPQSFNTLEGVKYSDEKAQDPKYDFERLVAEWDGQPVGYGSRSRTIYSEVPDQYFLFFNTLPEFRNRGIATAYFDRVESDLKENKNAASLKTFTRNIFPQAVSFLKKRGYDVVERITKSEIDLTQVDFEAYVPLRHKLASEGIEIRPLTELMDEAETYLSKLEELHWVLANDEPHTEPPKRISVQEFKEFYIDTPHCYPEGWFIATDGDRFVGWSAILVHKGRDDTMATGITVIDRPYRRRGLATAMKVTAFEHALALGRPRIETENEETNPMLDLNKQLGFRPIYQALDFKKVL